MKIGQILGLLALVGVVLLGLLEGTGIYSVGDGAGMVAIVLVVVGVILGFLNISKSEETLFLVGTFVLASSTVTLSLLPFVGVVVQSVFVRLAQLIVPASAVIAAKVVYEKIKD